MKILTDNYSYYLLYKCDTIVILYKARCIERLLLNTRIMITTAMYIYNIYYNIHIIKFFIADTNARTGKDLYNGSIVCNMYYWTIF